MRVRSGILVALLIVATLAIALGGGLLTERVDYTTEFGLENCRFLLPDGGTPYFSLEPGAFVRLEGEEEGEFIEVLITVLDEVRPIPIEINGRLVVAFSRVVEEREWVDGELAEISLNYYARCPDTGNIYNFGEDVALYEDGEVVSNEGSWTAGVESARPGLAMPAFYLLGSRYFTGIAPEISMDRAEHVAMGASYEAPAGAFENCIAVLETSQLEPDEEVLKVYAAGVGLIADGPLELVDYGPR